MSFCSTANPAHRSCSSSSSCRPSPQAALPVLVQAWGMRRRVALKHSLVHVRTRALVHSPTHPPPHSALTRSYNPSTTHAGRAGRHHARAPGRACAAGGQQAGAACGAGQGGCGARWGRRGRAGEHWGVWGGTMWRARAEQRAWGRAACKGLCSMQAAPSCSYHSTAGGMEVVRLVWAQVCTMFCVCKGRRQLRAPLQPAPQAGTVLEPPKALRHASRPTPPLAAPPSDHTQSTKTRQPLTLGDPTLTLTSPKP